MTESDITVAYSIYGAFDERRLICSLESARNQSIPIRLILSHESDSSSLDKLARFYNCSYIFVPNGNDSDRKFRPGKIRNRALDRIETKISYLNDADIIFGDSDYLRNIVGCLETARVLVKPPMRRIILSEAETFIGAVQDEGLVAVLSRINKSKPYVATMSGAPIDLVQIEKDGRIFTIERQHLEAYRADVSLKGREPTFFFDIVHCGAIASTTENIRAVGGFCERYATWGFEDWDLQWKLEQQFGLTSIPQCELFEVLHIDHPKGYFSAEDNHSNGKMFHKRRERGLAFMIAEDKLRNNDE